jgi:hypothetical protein
MDNSDLFKQLVDAGQANKERDAEELARAFVAGGEWLARQRDPFGQFKRFIATAATIDAMKLEDAHRQFERVFDPTVGKEGATKGFDLLVGLAMFKADPDQFYSTVAEAMLANLELERERKESLNETFVKPLNSEDKSLYRNSTNQIEPKNEEPKSIYKMYDWRDKKDYLINNFSDKKTNKWKGELLKSPESKIKPLNNENKFDKPRFLKDDSKILFRRLIDPNSDKEKDPWGKFKKGPLSFDSTEPEPVGK